jgi:hypothetical protein
LVSAVKLFEKQGLRSGIAWKKVKEHMNSNRSTHELLNRWHYRMRPSKKRVNNNGKKKSIVSESDISLVDDDDDDEVILMLL